MNFSFNGTFALALVFGSLYSATGRSPLLKVMLYFKNFTNDLDGLNDSHVESDTCSL